MQKSPPKHVILRHDLSWVGRRGGGEYGLNYWRAACGQNQPIKFGDVNNCVARLVSLGITCPSKLIAFVSALRPVLLESQSYMLHVMELWTLLIALATLSVVRGGAAVSGGGGTT